MSASTFCPYGLGGIRLVENDYPDVLDFPTPLMSDMIRGEDIVRISPKKRTRGKNAAIKQLGESRAQKSRFLG